MRLCLLLLLFAPPFAPPPQGTAARAARQYVELLAAGEIDQAGALLDEDITYTEPTSEVFGGTARVYRGKAAVLRRFHATPARPAAVRFEATLVAGAEAWLWQVYRTEAKSGVIGAGEAAPNAVGTQTFEVLTRLRFVDGRIRSQEDWVDYGSLLRGLAPEKAHASGEAALLERARADWKTLHRGEVAAGVALLAPEATLDVASAPSADGSHASTEDRIAGAKLPEGARIEAAVATSPWVFLRWRSGATLGLTVLRFGARGIERWIERSAPAEDAQRERPSLR